MQYLRFATQLLSLVTELGCASLTSSTRLYSTVQLAMLRSRGGIRMQEIDNLTTTV